MKHLMTIRQARLLGRCLAKELKGVCRCDFEGLWQMQLTSTEKKTYIEMYDQTIGKVYAFKYSQSRDAQPCTPSNWQTKPRGAARDEWQHIPEDFIEDIIKEHNIL